MRNVTSRADYFIARLTVIDQFEIYKAFLRTFDGPFNAKRADAWKECLDPTTNYWVRYVIDRRNELTHESGIATPPEMHEVVSYAGRLHTLARQLSERAKTR